MPRCVRPESWYDALRALAHAEQRMAQVGYAAFPAWLRARRECNRITPRKAQFIPWPVLRRLLWWTWLCGVGAGAVIASVVWFVREVVRP